MFRYPLFPVHYSINSYFFCFCPWVIQFHGVLAYLVENTYIHTHTDIHIYVYSVHKIPQRRQHCFDSHCTQQDLFQFPPFWWPWLPSQIVRSLPLLFFTRSTLFTSPVQSVSHAAATHPQNSTYCLSPENKKLWSKWSSFFLSKAFPSWTFPSLVVGRMKKKLPWGHRQRKGCRHRLTNILLPAFYWLFFSGVGVGCRLGIVDVQASLGLPYRVFERIPPFVSLWLPALMYRARKTEPRGGLSKLPGHTLILTRESTSSWMSVGSH